MPQGNSDTPSRPGEKALEVAKLVNELVEFKKPFPKAKSKPKVVLDEDVYVQEMGKIIQRDFFPDLEKLKAQNEYLEALEKHDIQKMRQLYTKYSLGKRPPTECRGSDASPATFETPLNIQREEAETVPDASPKNNEIIADAKDPNSKNRSLDEYLSSHTSEDNQSFQEIMKEAELKHRQKFSWLYDVEGKSEKEMKDKLALPSIEEQAENTDRPLMVDTWGYKNKNYIMYVPDGASLTPAEEIEMAKRKKVIIHANTRLSQNPFDEAQNRRTVQQLAASHAHSVQDGRIGVDGKEISSSKTPNVGGFSFVGTPSPAPGVNESPLMTWGEIEGTPFRLDGGDTPLRPGIQGPSFRIAEPPKREVLALSLAEKAGEWHRDRKKKAIIAARKQLTSPSPRATLDRLQSMSPAARRLASTSLRRSLGTDRALQASYSPRPSPRTPHTPLVKTPGLRTSAATSRTPASTSRTAQPRTPKLITTDNLLNLPRRPRASDFFDL